MTDLPCARYCPLVRDCKACIWRSGEPAPDEKDGGG